MPRSGRSGRRNSHRDLAAGLAREYLDDCSHGALSVEDVISIMVGDLQRIRLYGENGFQIPQDIPAGRVERRTRSSWGLATTSAC